jgi:hypothetical protein
MGDLLCHRACPGHFRFRDPESCELVCFRLELSVLEKMATAFISHASEDREIAERICRFLEERGIHCWVAPRDVRPGRRYGEEIVSAIETADAVVLLLTENANKSKQVDVC